MHPTLSHLLGPLDTLSERLIHPDSGPLLAALLLSSEELLEELAPLLTTDSLTGQEPGWVIAALAALEEETIDAAIDAALTGEETALPVLEALFRAGIAWDHPELPALLASSSRPGLPGLAAAHLAMAASPKLSSALENIEDEAFLLEALRSAALASEPDFFFKELLAWRQELDDDLAPRELAILDGSLAALSPLDFARRCIAGELNFDFFGDDRPIADLLTYRATNDWVDALAIFRTVRDRDGFELTAAFAVAATLSEVFDDVDDQTLQTTSPEAWIADHPGRLAFHLSVDEDETFTRLLVEATLHQAIWEREFTPAPMTGLPLSSGPVHPDQLFSLFSSLADPSSIPARVAILRSLTDLRRLITLELLPRESADPILAHFANSSVDAISQFVSAFDDKEAFENSSDWGSRGLFYLQNSLLLPPEEALPRLAQALFHAPIERAPAYRAAFQALLSTL